MYKLLIIGLIASGMAGYFIYSQNKINSLVAKNSEIQVLLENYVSANESLVQSIQDQSIQLEQARRASVAAEQRASKALEAFNDSDINYLSQKKPELIERIINEGTRDVLNQINTITSQ